MIDYIVRSGLCLVLLLAVYHLFLEKEKMHRFNRFFLLFSLAFGLLVPLGTMEFASRPLRPIEFSNVEEMVQPVMTVGNTNQALSADTSPGLMITVILIVYGLGVFLLSAKFIINLIKIAVKIRRHPRIKSGHSVLVLLREEVIPHSFLNYIFLNEETYMSKGMEEQIIVHELTHVRQKHSIDILVAELLKIIFWFNPVFILYKKAIQLNHEFLADESVIVSYHDVSAYQNLLLESASLKTVKLASNLNYSLTKKRLKMMKKHTSQGIAMLKELALIPLLIVLLFLFSKTIAQSESTVPARQLPMSKEEFYKGAVIYIHRETGKNVSKKYEKMTAAEKSNLPEPKSPTKDLMAAWKKYEQFPVIVDHKMPKPTDAPEQCRIFIDGENVESSTLDKYQPSDFISYSDSKFVKGGFTLISVNLYTDKYVKSLTAEAKLIMIYNKQTLVGRLNPAPINPPIMIPEKYRQTAVKK